MSYLKRLREDAKRYGKMNGNDRGPLERAVYVMNGEISRNETTIKDLDERYRSLLAENSELKDAISRMHQADDAFGCGFYGDEEWNKWYDLTKTLVATNET